MRIRVIEIVAAMGLTFAALLAFAKGVHAEVIEVREAVAAKSLTPQAKTGAVYLVLHNPGPEPDRLIAVATPAAEAAMLHRSADVDGVMTMEHIEGLDLAAGETMDFAAAGLHVMLMGLKAPLKQDETLTLTLTFEKAGVREIMANVGGKPVR